MDPANAQAEAILTREGGIDAVGRTADLRRLAPDAAVIDLGGRVALPGFVDAHNHFSLTALEPVSVDCRTPPVASMAELLLRVHEAAAVHPPGRWLRGHGYDDAFLGRHPTRAELDDAAPHNPVVLIHWSVHRCVANSAALRAAGIDPSDPGPEGGWRVRDAGGSLTGLLYERATDPLQAASITAYAAAGVALDQLFKDNAGRMLRQGITALGDAYLHPSLAPVYDRVRLPITVRPFCGSAEGLFAPPSACLAAPAAAGGDTAGAGLLPAGIKIFADGGGNTTATSLASGRPPRLLFYRQDALDALVGRAHAAGLPVAIHAAGDIAVSMALDAIERARLAYPAIEPRFRIEHAITIRRPDIPRLRALEVAVVTQPEAVYHAGDALSAAALAPDVLIAPFRALLDSGVMLAFSSDSPCYALSPLWQIWCAVKRATASGATLDDGQSVTMEEALVAYTRAGAAAIFTKQAGQLSPGRRADMLLLPIDPRALSPDRLRDLRIEQTWCAGRLVSESADEQEQPPGRPVPLP